MISVLVNCNNPVFDEQIAIYNFYMFVLNKLDYISFKSCLVLWSVWSSSDREVFKERCVYLHFLWLVPEVAGRDDGPRACGDPVGQHRGESAQTQQCGGGQRADELTQILQLRQLKPQQQIPRLHLLHKSGAELWQTHTHTHTQFYCMIMCV